MIEFKGKIISLQEDYISGSANITIQTNKQHLQALSELDGDISVKVNKWRNKRSLNANAYCWKLCTEIANVLTLQGAVVTKDDIYLQMLKSYGQSDIVTVLSIVPPADYFKYYEKVATGELNNKEYTHYKVFKGSSEYDSREMSVLLDGIVAEAEALGIHTATKNDIEDMKRRWGYEEI